jgi:alanine dehydrogenase
MLDLAVDYIKDLQKQAEVFEKILILKCVNILFMDYYLINFLQYVYVYIQLYRSFKIVKQSVPVHTSNNNNGKE